MTGLEVELAEGIGGTCLLIGECHCRIADVDTIDIELDLLGFLFVLAQQVIEICSAILVTDDVGTRAIDVDGIHY